MTWQMFKTGLTAAIVAFAILFVVQNTEVVRVEILFWTLEIRRVFLIVIILAVGVVLGWVLSGWARRDRG